MNDYYKEKFISDGARELQLKEFKDSLNTIRTIKGEDAYWDELLSELPLKGLNIK